MNQQGNDPNSDISFIQSAQPEIYGVAPGSPNAYYSSPNFVPDNAHLPGIPNQYVDMTNVPTWQSNSNPYLQSNIPVSTMYEGAFPGYTPENVPVVSNIYSHANYMWPTMQGYNPEALLKPKPTKQKKSRCGWCTSVFGI